MRPPVDSSSRVQKQLRCRGGGRRADAIASPASPLRALEEFVAELPEQERAAIEKRTAELVEQVTLRRLREARKQSRKGVARKLNVNQAAVSKLERRPDMFVSTLRDYIESAGGTLEIVARFPNQAVKINPFRGLGSKNRAGVEISPSGGGTSTH